MKKMLHVAGRRQQQTWQNGVVYFQPSWFLIFFPSTPFQAPSPRNFLLCVLTISLASSISRSAALSVCFFGSRKKKKRYLVARIECEKKKETV